VVVLVVVVVMGGSNIQNKIKKNHSIAVGWYYDMQVWEHDVKYSAIAEPATLSHQLCNNWKHHSL